MKLILSTLFLFLLTFGIGQTENTVNYPKKQYTSNFKFKPFTRDLDASTELDKKIRALESKTVSNWNAYDSIVYGYELNLLNEAEKAYFFINGKELDTLTKLSDLHLLQEIMFKNADFNTLTALLNTEIQNYPITKEITAFRIEVGEALEKHRQQEWNPKEDTLFSFLYDTIYYQYNKDRVQQKTILIPIAQYLDKALRYYVKYAQRSSNPVLSKAYEEFGDFLNRHFYASNAFIAYSVSRYYNKKNGAVSKKIKAVKEALEAKNYIVPSFRKIFNKIQPGRFDYAVLKEKAKENKKPKVFRSDAPKAEITDYIPTMSASLLTVIGLAFLLIFLLVFLKTKPKKSNYIEKREQEVSEEQNTPVNNEEKEVEKKRQTN